MTCATCQHDWRTPGDTLNPPDGGCDIIRRGKAYLSPWSDRRFKLTKEARERQGEGCPCYVQGGDK
jgi:hypothetical protein